MPDGKGVMLQGRTDLKSVKVMSCNIYRGDSLEELAKLLTWSYTALTTNISSTVIANRSNT